MDYEIEKLERLRKIIRSYEKVLVAFSGGADSAFVLKVAREVLGRGNVRAAIAKSPSLAAREFADAQAVAREIDAELIVVETQELENPRYASNPVHRCYFCKSELYSHLIPLAEKLGLPFVLNGTNQDDLGDWRPGLEAAREYQVRSPLVEAELTKEEIRFFSRLAGLSTWSKPQAACLSSRFPFGTEITEEKLRQVEEGEEILKGFGFKIVRLRWGKESATIEVSADETDAFFQDADLRQNILSRLQGAGFQQAGLHIKGYRSGRFNPSKEKKDFPLPFGERGNL